MSRAVLVLPGRGSYTERTMGQLPTEHSWVQEAESIRAKLGLDPLLDLDRAERFSPARHLRPSHVSPLIYLRTMLDVERVLREHEVVAIVGNSMGWYTALAAGGSLSFKDGFHLVQQMSILQEEHGSDGGQIVYPLVGEDWKRIAEREAAVEAVVSEYVGELFYSIHLGGQVVLAGSRGGLSAAAEALDSVQQGRVTYPLRLAQHGPYHTPLVEATAMAARTFAADLVFHQPEIELIDGLGRRHTPWGAELEILRGYTFGAQIVGTYDFTRSVEVALCEHAPDHLIAVGPGNTLGGICGQILAGLHWRGIDSKETFLLAQEGDTPPLISLDR
ncbi:MAG: ACP S-malonyltransferase [Planctomycetes bacterium]|nr:ACP S-malonyltransferase [Planctomycetota bacterium]